MTFDSKENSTFEFDGYRVRLASGTSSFRGDTPRFLMAEAPTELWAELNEENYRLIGDNLFQIDFAERKPGILSNIPPRLHIELVLPGPNRWHEESYIVLILDNDGASLVDWAIANPAPATSHFVQEDSDRSAIYFDIPLVPVTRNESRYADRTEFLDQISHWQGGPQLTFGIFSIEDDEITHLTHRLIRTHWKILPHPFYDRYDRLAFSGFVDFIAKKADGYLKKNTQGKEVLQIIPENGVPHEVTAAELKKMDGKVLLLCHGILSSTQGAFEGILGDAAFYRPLFARYEGRILAWDHYTLSKTTAENADDLLMGKLLDLHNVTLDIVCHSRGAGVIRNFLENPVNRQTLQHQNIKIDKVIFVAGACLGSQLAQPENTNRMFRRLNMLFWFLGGTPAGFIKAILTILKLLATVAQKMPGVEAMNPVGGEIAKLNLNQDTAAAEYHYIRANYDNPHLPLKLLEEFFLDSGVFDGAANDLVVPYEGASPSGKYLANSPVQKIDTYHYGDEQTPQPKVMHTNFFYHAQTQSELDRLLP
ncbi:MAG: hypothetical protein Q8J80_08000 [Gallionella sp.]|nr:hypothetical protein [Gallionella sp.]